MEENRKKRAIVAAYLSGKYSYRDLQARYGYSVGAIHKWVKQSQDPMSKPIQKEEKEPISESAIEEVMPTDVKALQEALRKSRLHNKVLTAVIEIAEEELGVPIRKNSGAKQS